MKISTLLKSILWAVIAVIVFTWSACNPPQFSDIEQPGSADYYDTFGVDITVSQLEYNSGPESVLSQIGIALPEDLSVILKNSTSTEYRLVFGIKLPEGWNVTDNIPFTGDDEGVFAYSDSLTQVMTSSFPPDTGYFWWVSETQQTMDTSMGYIYFTPVITTDGSRGSFYLDYSLGFWNGNNLTIRESVSADHLITVGLPDTVYVTALSENGPGSIRAAIDSVSQGGTILFDLLFPATIVLSSPLEMYKSVNITGPSNGSLSFSGNSACRVINVHEYKSIGLANVKIINGLSDYAGGGIALSSHSEGVLYNVEITNNQALYTGGGIYAYEADLLRLEKVTVSGNSALNGSGGGIAINYSEFDLTEVTVSDNQSTNSGGGIYIAQSGYYGSHLSEMDIFNNQAVDGGGLYIQLYSESNYGLFLQNSSIHHNSAGSGGGIYISTGFTEDPILQFSETDIFENEASYQGGGIFCGGLVSLSGVTIRKNLSGYYGGGISSESGILNCDPFNRCSIYLNSATYGYDIYGYLNETDIISLDTFSVLYPNDYFFYRFEEASGFDILHGIIPQIDQDIYVSPQGSDDNDGLSPGSPFRTLTHALELIISNPDDPNTINLAPGSYLGNTDFLAPHIRISGTGADNCFVGGLDSYKDEDVELEGLKFEQHVSLIYSQVLIENFFINYGISCFSGKLSMANGEIRSGYFSVAMQIENSVNDCENVVISSSHKGLSCYSSTVNLDDCLLEDNMSGGMEAFNSTINLSGTTIRHNESDKGGGIYLYNSFAYFDPVSRCNIYENYAANGCDLYIDEEGGYNPLNVIVDTFSVLQPTQLFAYPIDFYGFDILHGKTEQVTADLYFSPEGSDLNTGLTPGDPLRSITLGTRKFLTDYTQHTFYLAPGTYSEAMTGEHFPLQLPGYLTLEGAGRDITKIFGSYNNYVDLVTFYGYSHDTLRNLTIDGANSSYGSNAGIVLENNDIYLQNMIIKNCVDGIKISGTGNFTADSLTITNNQTGILCRDATTTLNNMIITHNGVGVYIANSELDLEHNEINNNDWGIEASASELYLHHCNIKDSQNGGGRFNDCGGLFIGNFWEDNVSNSSGGGLYLNNNSLITFIDDEFLNNSAQGNGGGICSENSNPVFVGCNFQGNSSSIAGGGAYFGNSGFCLVGCMMENNSAQRGGAIYDNRENGYLSGTTIRNNFATDGGGIYYANGYILEGYEWDDDSRCNIYLNRALGVGHDLYSSSETLVHTVVVDTFTVNVPTDDFAWHTYNFDFNFLNSIASAGNYDVYVSPEGDDNNSGFTPDDPVKTLALASTLFMFDTLMPHKIFLEEGVYSPSMTGETFPVSLTESFEITGSGRETTILDAEGSGNLFTTYGSIELLSMNNLTLRNGFLDGADAGGAVSVDWTDLKLEKIIVENCSTWEGGAIYALGSNLYFSDVILKGNSASNRGGALYTNQCYMELKETDFIDNYAFYDGGGWYATGITTLKGENVQFRNNSTYEYSNCRGGALVMEQASGRLEGFSVDSCFSHLGGGISIIRSDVDFYNIVVRNNEAESEGGGLFASNSTVGVHFATFSGNLAPTGSGMSITYDSDATFSHSIFPDGPEGKINLRNSGIDIQYSDITGGNSALTFEGNNIVNWLDGNIDADPLFEGSGDYPLALSAGSPCIDAGIQDTTGMNFPFWDLAGNYRLWDGDEDGDDIADMGAYEFGSIGVGEEELTIQSSKFKVAVFPNPACGIVGFNWPMTDDQRITLRIYDAWGKEVAAPADAVFPAGEHTVIWDATALPAGVYFYRLIFGGKQSAGSGKFVKL